MSVFASRASTARSALVWRGQGGGAVRQHHVLRRHALADLADTVLHSRSGHYIALLLNEADAVITSQLHQVLDPYLNRLERRIGADPAAVVARGLVYSPPLAKPPGSATLKRPPARRSPHA